MINFKQTEEIYALNEQTLRVVWRKRTMLSIENIDPGLEFLLDVDTTPYVIY